jgi:anti-sigma factor RsiW
MDAAPEYPDALLMAYADGEVDAATSQAIARAADSDAALAARIARHRAVRADVLAAFAPVLDEPVPARLAALLTAPAQEMQTPPRVASVTRLADRRRPAAGMAGASNAGARSSWTSWATWGGVAASLVIGVVAAVALHDTDRTATIARTDRPAVAGPDIITVAGRMQAGGALAEALSTQLASTQAPLAEARTPVRIGTSFMSRSATVCRTFTLQASTASEGIAGLACRVGDTWQLPVLSETTSETGVYRTAASGLPLAVAAAVDARIQGAPLDAEGERNAMQLGWKR